MEKRKSGGRPQSNPIHNFFDYNEADDTSMCKEKDCKRPKMTGKHAGNLTHHLKSAHKVKYLEYLELFKENQEANGHEPKRRRIKVEISSDEIYQNCVALVTIHGRPFALLEDEAFQNLINPMIKGFTDEKFTISPKTIQEKLVLEAKGTREKIKKELKQAKLISLKYDIASRLGKSFLGVNVQFIAEGKVQLRTLAVIALKDRHTAIYLKSVILDILREYEIDLNVIYTCTSDNAASMMKLSELLRDDQEENSLRDVETTSEMSEEKSLNELVQVCEDFEQGLVIGVRCAAHTLQLCVWDVWKNEKDAVISKARNIVKALRRESMTNTLADENIAKPVIDNNTRWSSTYLMLKSLLEAKHLCDELSSTDKTFTLSKEEWNQLRLYVEALAPVHTATIKFQSEQLLPGDFYVAWIQCKIDVQKLSSLFAKQLLSAMKKREEKLFDNDAFLAAIYLDPRFRRCIFTRQIGDSDLNRVVREQKAIKTIKNIWEHIEKNNVLEQEKSTETLSANNENELDDLDRFLQDSVDIDGESSNSSNVERVTKIDDLISKYNSTPTMQRKEDLLLYWESRKSTDPELYTLAMITNAVPMTQVSVERLFSGMKYVFSDLRANLSEALLQDILLIRTNGFFFKKKNIQKTKIRRVLNNSTCNSSIENNNDIDKVNNDKKQSNHDNTKNQNV